MCDDDIHQGLVHDPRLSRRGFGLAAAGLGLAATSALADTTVTRTEVTIATPDGQADAVLFQPARADKWPAVLIWPDIMSLRPVFEDMGRRLAAEGYVVLVPNLYYRVRKAPVIDGTFDFANQADRDKLTPLRASVTPEGTLRDARAYLAFLDAQPATDTTRKAGAQGYCMGGPLAFRTAAAVPDRIGAVATFHGGGLVTQAPDSPHLLIAQTHAEYLVEI
ncbi:MAG: dienelactone hydrolase family protein, partial [Asticcacaulis sp.]|nr:dienelactone hydrolase family protein [Asticcacaulis sp.]